MYLVRLHVKLIRCMSRRQEAALFWFVDHCTGLSTTTTPSLETAHQGEFQSGKLCAGVGAALTAHHRIDVEKRLQKRPLLM
jgi:hypothetical protein